jgi:putative ABC transporter permease protein MJ0087
LFDKLLFFLHNFIDMNRKNEKTLSVSEQYNVAKAKKIAIILILLALVFLFFVVSVFVGSGTLSFKEVFLAIFNKGSETARLIVRRIRFPRVIAALIAGGGLAVSGLVMQTVLKNPLASPTTLGVSNAAVFGANFAIIVVGAGAFHSTHGSWLSISNPYLVSTFSFLSAIIAAGLILLLARLKNLNASAIVLAGVAVSAIFQAGTTLIQYFASDTQVASAVYWTFGDLGRASYKTDLIMFIVVAVSTLFFFLKRWDFSAMSGGIAYAKTLGVNTRFMTIMSLLLASLITSVTVSFLGIIGFVGLTAPQFMKRIVGDDYRFLLPSSFLAGALLLLISDILGRLPIFGTSVPVGVVTSLIGGPVFLAILLRRKKNESENI